MIEEELLKSIKQILLELCSHPDPEPEQDDPQQENYSGFRDPMSVAINHVRPMALKELLWYGIVRSNLLKLTDGRWEDDVENKVTEMLNDDIAYSVRSVLGEKWPCLYYLDKNWAEENHNKIFPADDPCDRYFLAAWDSYITHNYVNEAGYDLTRPLYIIAIDNAIAEHTTHTHLGIADSLADHLVVLYLYDIEDLALGSNVSLDNPLAHIYSQSPNKIHSHMTWRLWKMCDDEEDTEKRIQIWEKAKLLWKFRLENVEEEDWNECFAQELTWFIHFLTISQLSIRPDEIRELLVKTIPPLGNCDREHGLSELVKYLASISDDHVADSVTLLAQIFDTHGADWYLKDESVEWILDNATRAGQDVRNSACSIVHKLGECGKDWAQPYLDKLRR